MKWGRRLRMPTNITESIPRLKRLIPRMRGKRMGVVGDLMLDSYLWGEATRLSPEAAVPVVDFVSQSECLGGAGNVAANLAALGAHVETFGVIGSDEAGRSFPEVLAREEHHRKRSHSGSETNYNAEDTNHRAPPPGRQG